MCVSAQWITSQCPRLCETVPSLVRTLQAESPDCPRSKMILCFGRHVKPWVPVITYSSNCFLTYKGNQNKKNFYLFLIIIIRSLSLHWGARPSLIYQRQMEDLTYTPHAGQTGWGGLMFAYLSLGRLLRHPWEEWEWSYSALPQPHSNKIMYDRIVPLY